MVPALVHGLGDTQPALPHSPHIHAPWNTIARISYHAFRGSIPFIHCSSFTPGFLGRGGVRPDGYTVPTLIRLRNAPLGKRTQALGK